jgi:hypothetical protein
VSLANWGDIWGDVWGPIWAEEASSPPVFSGTIPNISRNQSTGTHTYQLGGYFSGATSFSIAPAVESGWTFNTSNGELVIDTDAVGVFGTYVVTGTNSEGTADSNAFSVTVVAVTTTSQPSGGWLTFLNTYEQQRSRRKKEEQERRALEEETEQIQDTTDREIAQLLRVQEAKDAKRAELERLTELARANQDLEAARRYSERVAKAYQAVLEKGSRSAAERLEKELRRAAEEEEFMLLAIMLLLE